MRNGTIASLLVVALLAGAGVGFLVDYSNQRTISSTTTSFSTLFLVTTHTVLQTSTIQQTVTTVSPTTLTSYSTYTAYTPIVTAGCDVPPDLYLSLWSFKTTNSSTILEREQLAVVLQPGSNATLWVAYCPDETDGPVTLTPAILVESCLIGPGGGGCDGTPAPDVEIAAVPNQVVFENQSLTIVAYHISADTNSTGYYLIGVPHFCPSVGLAIGHPANQLNHTDFPWMGPIPCGLSFGGVMSVSGANTTYVDLG